MRLATWLMLGLCGLSSIGMASQQDKIKDPWMVRLRALNMVPANNSRAFSALGLNFAADAISLNTKTFPEVDLTYFITKNIAVELVLTYPQQHDVTLTGVGNIGTVTHLPPTLSVQYRFPIDNNPLTPYVGLGINYTKIARANLNAAGTNLDVTRDSFGIAYGVGVDYKLNETWSLNLDFKHVNITTNVKVQATGAILTNLDVTPNLFSIGIGYRFR